MRTTKFQPKNNSIVVDIRTNVTDFKKYKILESVNRPVSKAHVARLAASLFQYGTAGATVTVVRTKAWNKYKWEEYTADGQHRMPAAQMVNLPLTVIVVQLVEDTTLNVTNYIAALNNSKKAWSNKNYTTAYANIGIPEYKVFDQMEKQHGLTATDLQYIYLGGANAPEVKDYKTGVMKFSDKKKSEEMLCAVIQCMKRIPSKAYIRRPLYRLMHETEDYKFIAQAITHCKVKFSENEAEFADQIRKIYERAKKTQHNNKAMASFKQAA